MQWPASSWSVSARGWQKRFSPGHTALGRVLEDVWPGSVQIRSFEGNHVRALCVQTFGMSLMSRLTTIQDVARFASTPNVHCVETVTVVFGPAFNAILESSFSSDGSLGASAGCAMSTGP